MVWLSGRVTRGRSDVFHVRRDCGSALFDIRAPQRDVEAAGLRRCRHCATGVEPDQSSCPCYPMTPGLWCDMHALRARSGA